MRENELQILEGKHKKLCPECGYMYVRVLDVEIPEEKEIYVRIYFSCEMGHYWFEELKFNKGETFKTVKILDVEDFSN